MSDPFANEMLSAYLDGELSDGDRKELEASLADDASLRAELDALAEARRFLADHGPVAAPAGFLEDVLAAVEQEPEVVQLSWYRRPFGIPIEGLAVAAAALLVVYIALPGGAPEAPAPGKGAGAAIVSQSSMPKEEVLKEEVGSSYGGDAYRDDAVVDAEADGTEEIPAPREKDASEGTIDPAANVWEPPMDGDDDGVAVADLESQAKNAGVNEKLALPTKKGFGLAESKESKEQAAAEERARLKAEAEAATDLGIDTRTGDAEPEGSSFSRVPYSYTLYTEDPQVLFRLAALAAKHRGEVTDTEKHALEVTELQGTDATVLVKIPAHALTEFGREIGALGSVYTAADNTMFAGDPVEVRVRVQLAGGASEGTDQAPNAARKAKQRYMPAEADAVEELQAR